MIMRSHLGREGLRWKDAAEGLGFAVLLLLLLIAPFPYGSVLPMGKLRIEILGFLAFGLAMASRRYDRIGWLALPLLATLGVAAVGVFQLIPLPDSVLRVISPVSLAIHQEEAAVLKLFSRNADRPRISIVPSETLGAVLLVLSYAALYRAAITVLSGVKRRQIASAVLVAAATVHVIGAMALNRKDRLTGAFVNPNHFAGYLEIALPFALAFLWEASENVSGRSAKKERSMLPLIAAIGSWTILAAGIGLTRSRAGIVVAILATMAFVMGCARRRSNRRVLLVAGGAMVVAMVIVAGAVRGQALARFLSSDPLDPQREVRPAIWRTSIEAWREFPILGSGLGTFPEAFRRVQKEDLPWVVEQAHSDPLQLLVTGGAVGLGLGILAMMSLLAVMITGSGRGSAGNGLNTLAATVAVASIAMHGFVEFNLSIPSIAGTLAIVAGLAGAAICDERELRGTSERAEAHSGLPFQ
jgi:O-antigen ligase